MRTKNLLKYTLIIWLLIGFFPSNASERLFHIDRSRDSDKVVYAINKTTHGELDDRDPILVYWLSESNNTKPLTHLQNRMGYGTQIIETTEQHVIFSIRAFSDQKFKVQHNTKHLPVTYTTIDSEEVEVTSLFIGFTPGTIWVPEIDYVQLKGKAIKTNQAITKTIKGNHE